MGSETNGELWYSNHLRLSKEINGIDTVLAWAPDLKTAADLAFAFGGTIVVSDREKGVISIFEDPTPESMTLIDLPAED